MLDFERDKQALREQANTELEELELRMREQANAELDEREELLRAQAREELEALKKQIRDEIAAEFKQREEALLEDARVQISTLGERLRTLPRAVEPLFVVVERATVMDVEQVQAERLRRGLLQDIADEGHVAV